MSDFWIGFIIGGFICGIIGFLGAAILAASGRTSRMEEKIEETLTFNSKGVQSYKNFDDKKDTYMVVTQNDPRTD